MRNLWTSLLEFAPTLILTTGFGLLGWAFSTDPLPTPVRFVMAAIAGLCVFFWETSPWSLHRDLHRVCRRLKAEHIDFLYDSETETVMVTVISKTEECRPHMVEEKDGEAEA